jgi:glycosyltransferase involved in cell wall biosynthesis
MIAAATLGVPGRIYLARGLRLEGTSGVLRRGLGVAEIVASRCAHQVVCVSESLRAAYASGGYAPERKLTVIPSNGVDATAFGERERYREQAAAIRAQLGIPADAMVVGFVGRLAADKGIADLLRAFERASHSVSTLHLLVVGGSFAGDDLPPDLAQGLRHPRVRLSGTVEDPAPYYAAMDMLAFPSYREGLPNVPLEAASCELPSIGYRSTGVVDAIAHDCTGVIVDRKDDRAMAEAIVAYARSTELRTRHGLAARARVLRQFTNERVWQQWLDLYRSMPTHS